MTDQREYQRQWRAQRRAQGITAHHRPYKRDPLAAPIVRLLQEEHPAIHDALRTRAVNESNPEGEIA